MKLLKLEEFIFRDRDWRLFSITAISFGIAVISAHQLESRFFMVFMPNETLAKILAIFVMGGITLAAHFLSDNFRQKQHKIWTDYANLIALLVVYAAILYGVLGMSNFVMGTTRTEKDSNKVLSVSAQAESRPAVLEAKKVRDAQLSKSDEQISRLKTQLAVLSGTLYLSKQEALNGQIAHQQNLQKQANDQYQKVLQAEVTKLEQHSVKVVNAGEQSKGGGFVAETPALVIVLALVALFCARLTFDSNNYQIQPQAQQPMATVNERVVEESLTHRRIERQTEAQIPLDLEMAVLMYRAGQISSKTGWPLRRIADKFCNGNVNKVYRLIKSDSPLPVITKIPERVKQG